MTLSPGTRLGSYEIVSPLGAGGMGEVYLARDAKLEREVAIKVLPHELSDDPETLDRFQREAKAVAALSHPNILAIYDFGDSNGILYAVTELLEGETLRARLRSGPLPPRRALECAAQIARGLAATHERGIVHRDLKPENVFLTRDGRVKILDFGLAKQTRDGVAPSQLGGAKTVSGTLPGAVLGTMGYMSPEQVRGLPADSRSDLFAFGAVFYEMLAGRRAFHGDSAADTMSAILREEPPDLAETNRNIPLALDRIVRHCLEKNPEARVHSAHDLAFELEALSGETSATAVRSAPAGRASARPRIVWLLAGIFAVVAAAALVLASVSSRAPDSPAFHQLNFRREAIFQAAFTAEGKTVVYSAAILGNTPQIFSVRSDYPEPQPVGPRGMHLLAVSSTGELAVLMDARYVWHRLFTGTLARMTLGGGAPREIQEGVRQADWSPDGSQLAIIREVEGKDRLEYPIGHVLREVSGYMTDLRFSRRGDRIAYFEHPRKWDDRGSVNVVDLAGKNTMLSDGYWSARGLAWSPDGEEILFSASTSGGSFTVYGVTLSGKTRLAYQVPGGLNIQDVARDGRWLVTRGDFRYAAMVHTPGDSEDRDLSWLNTSHARALSQDGETLLFTETTLGSNYAACLRKTDGTPVLRLGEGWSADLSADGKWVLAVVQTRPPELVLYPTGAGEIKQLERGGIENYATAEWFRDGKSVLVCGNEPRKGTRFYVQEVSGGAPRPVTPEGTRDGKLSADGQTILARGPEGNYVVYPIAGGEARPVKGLTDADVLALWSVDGKSVLAFRRGEIPYRLERVDLATGNRTLFKELAPADRAGLLALREVFVTDDQRSYAYTAYYQVSSLFVSEVRK